MLGVFLGGDFRDERGLLAAWPGCVALGRDDADVLEVQLGCHQSVWALGDRECKSSPQRPRVHRSVGDRVETEAPAILAVDPVSERTLRCALMTTGASTRPDRSHTF